MTIREITASDYTAVEEMALSLHRETLAHRPDLFTPLEEFYSPELFREWTSGAVQDAIWLVAEEDGSAAGICLTRVNDRREMHAEREPCVDLLYVREPYRRRGIARELLEETQRRAKAMGLSTLILCVEGYNEGAMRLYEDFGMKPRKLYYEKNI
ncbi:MAG: GNAT family N-acetyltransferase [Oscillospiraceae bacterium]|nr:GNAT family N-acetyltransferase [Oscillospiraceae bacterium]